MSIARGLSWQHLLTAMAAPPRDEDAWAEAQRRLQEFARFARVGAKRLDPDFAAEVAARVLAKLYQSPNTLAKLTQPTPQGEPKNYLIAMVCHAALDLTRQENRYAGRVAPLPDPDTVFDSAPSPFEEAARRDQAERLRELLDKHLQGGDRELLRQRFWENWPLAQIAKALKVPYHTAAMRLFRLQRLLLQVLQEAGWQN
jgi:RNA polymerase sigma factor (sigma-70 family)